MPTAARMRRSNSPIPWLRSNTRIWMPLRTAVGDHLPSWRHPGEEQEFHSRVPSTRQAPSRTAAGSTDQDGRRARAWVAIHPTPDGVTEQEGRRRESAGKPAVIHEDMNAVNVVPLSPGANAAESVRPAAEDARAADEEGESHDWQNRNDEDHPHAPLADCRRAGTPTRIGGSGAHCCRARRNGSGVRALSRIRRSLPGRPSRGTEMLLEGADRE
jgi:hypothetical protein